MSGGSLLETIEKRGHLTEQEASLVVRDIAMALSHLHRRGNNSLINTIPCTGMTHVHTVDHTVSVPYVLLFLIIINLPQLMPIQLYCYVIMLNYQELHIAT